MMMPLYLIGMLTFLGYRGLTPRRSIVLITFFALPLLAAVAFVITNPIVIEQTVARYAMGPPDSGAMMRARWYLNYNALQDQLSGYFDFFNPANLFLAGGTDLMNSTRMAGVLLIGAAPLLAVGLYRAGMQERTQRTGVAHGRQRVDGAVDDRSAAVRLACHAARREGRGLHRAVFDHHDCERMRAHGLRACTGVETRDVEAVRG